VVWHVLFQVCCIGTCFTPSGGDKGFNGNTAGGYERFVSW